MQRIITIVSLFLTISLQAQFNQFTFLKGNTTDYRYGSYGTLGIASVSNNPGIRRFQTTWQYNNKIYLFGGEGVGRSGEVVPPTGFMNDLWEYDPVTNNWRWLKGFNGIGGNPVYGTKGITATTNTPGARKNAMGWVHNNKFYLFGGSNGPSTGRFCDLWEYDPATNNWTWIAGVNTTNSAGSYGTLGVAAATNLPPAREEGVTWIFNNKLYLFGGNKYNGVNDVQMNDMWEYDFVTGWWTWIKGSSLTNQFGVYGIKGVASASNMPGSRLQPGFASIGNKVYMYGGVGYGAASGGVLSDLWEYDNGTGNWTWLFGSTVNDELKVPGIQGTYNAGNTPGAKTGCNVTVQNNTLYLYGGFAPFFGGTYQSDLWQYNPVINQWRWLKGTSGAGTIGDYGLVNVEATSNLPGGRGTGTLVTIGTDLYLFGGRGYKAISSVTDENQNDLWRFNTSNNNWTWLKGASGKDRYAEPGTAGVASPTNKPGDKMGNAMAVLNNKIYVFGGVSKRTYNNESNSNDLWEYDPATNNWTFLKGSSSIELAGNYGTQGIAAPTNLPDARTEGNLWGYNNKLYLFGGRTNSGTKNDLWEYNPATNNWTWIKGSNGFNQAGVYGSKGLANIANIPGGRHWSTNFTYNNKLYLYGGDLSNSSIVTTGLSFMNDLWEYDPATNNWTWIAGDNVMNIFGVYGTQGVPDAANKPGGRIVSGVEVISNKIYLFGGAGKGASVTNFLNDLWTYDFSSGLWTFIKGSNTGIATASTGVFGVEASTNMPASRGASCYTVGGKFYAFAGTNGNWFNDLWEYNPTTNNWRWIKGAGNITTQPGSYGLTGVAYNSNVPGSRVLPAVAIAGNTAYFFGGNGFYANNVSGPSVSTNPLSDLWKWNGNSLSLNSGKLYVNDNSLSGDVFTTAIGSDDNNGSPSAPLASVDYAVFIAQPGDSIFVDAGIYVTPNFSITKSVTILGSNYNASPNNPADRLAINPVRNANSLITGSTFTIAGNDVSLEGLAFNPGAKSQVVIASTGASNFTFKRNYSIVSATFFLNLTGPLIPFGQASLFGNYLIEDNRFESQVTINSLCIVIGALNDVTVNNNSFFTPPTSQQRLLTSCNPSGLTVNFHYSNNISNSARNELFTANINIVSARIENNISLHGQRAYVFQISNTTNSDIQVRNNYIETNFAELSPIEYRRGGTSLPNTLASLLIEDNTIIQNPAGRTSVPAAITARSFFDGSNPSLTIRRNNISFTGDYSTFPGDSVLGIVFPGNTNFSGSWQNINLEENEITFNGTNLTNTVPVSGPSSSGIMISSDGISANAVINIAGNKINGFSNSIAVYDESSLAPNTYVGYGNLPAGVTLNINNNSLTGGLMAINNGTTGQSANASCNWYGASDEETINSKLTLTSVQHIPWLTNGTDNNTATGFQPVSNSCNGYPRKLYVNDGVLTSDVFTTGIGNNANIGSPAAPFATLDFAYSVAEPGDTIYVDAGYYQTSTDITLNKSITLLGTNYQISPKDPSNPLQLNPARLTESVVANHRFIIAANDIRIKGFYLDPASKTQIQQTVTTNDFDNIEIEKNQFSITWNTTMINVTGRQVSPLVTVNYIINDNWFVKDFGTGGTTISINAIDAVQINNNVFTTDNLASNNARIQTGILVGGLTGDIVISNNNVYQQNFFVQGIAAKKTIISFNTADECIRFAFASSGNVNPNEVEITDNIITNPRSTGGPVISYVRNNGTNLSAPNISRIERNTITLNGTGLAFVAQALIGPTLDVASANTQVYIRDNKLTITGDFSTIIGANNYVSAIRFLTVSRLAVVERNEMEFTATNYSSPNRFGIGILHNGLQSGASFNFQNNKFSGFPTSVGIQNNGNANAFGQLPNGVTVNINNNSFTGDLMSINNGTVSQTLQATCNWYGSTAAQIIKDKLSTETVQAIPWLTNGTDNDPATGFQPVPGACDGYPPMIVLDDSTNVTCNGANNGTINITVSYGLAPFTFTWTKEGDPGFVSNDEDLSNLAPGIYHLAVVDANGSTIYVDANGDITTIQVNIEEPDVLIASASGTNNLCFGASEGTATIIAGGGTSPYTYLWNNGETNETITSLAAGTYSVTVTDANNCTAIASYEVTQPTQVTASMANTSTACSNIATVTAGGGVPGYTYLWSNGSTLATINGVPIGTYSVTVTDANSCTATASVDLTVGEAFNPSATVTNVSCFNGANGIITVTNANGTAPFMFSKDGGVNFEPGTLPFSFTNLAPDTYQIAVKDFNGCTGFITKTVTQPTQLTVTLNNVNKTCFGLSTGSINLSVAGGTPGYSYQWTGTGGYTSSQLNINNLAAGNYSLTVTDNKGCSVVQPVSVLPYDQVLVNEVVTNVLCKGETSGSINLSVSGGTNTSYSYLWNNGSTAEDRINLGVGNYSVIITDNGSGCTVARNYTITQPANTVAISTNKTNATGCNLGTITITGSGGTPGYTYSINSVDYQNANTFINLPAGSYTVWVKDANGCTKSAVVSITDNGSDGFESNNSKNQAKPINVSDMVNARIALATDVADWFKFTAGLAGDYVLNLAHPSPSIFTFNLYPAGNNAPALIPSNPTSTSKTYNLAQGTTYYISVTGGLSFNCYQLVVTPPFVVTARGSYDDTDLTSEIEQAPVDRKLNALAYPNPHQGSFTLQIESPEDGMVNIQLLSADGKLITVKTVIVFKGRSNTVAFSNIREAVLFYRVRLGKLTASGKIIGPN